MIIETGTETATDNLFQDRDLAWVEFNRRVLCEAEDERTPLLERVKFLAIFSTNLDEFFMKRVGLSKLHAAAIGAFRRLLCSCRTVGHNGESDRFLRIGYPRTPDGIRSPAGQRIVRDELTTRTQSMRGLTIGFAWATMQRTFGDRRRAFAILRQTLFIKLGLQHDRRKSVDTWFPEDAFAAAVCIGHLPAPRATSRGESC